ncbi:MAG: hypothetical protein AAF236_04340 [Verrucomicrobiota bacterium]
MKRLTLFSAVFFVSHCFNPAHADPKSEDLAPGLHRVETGEIEVTVELEGVFNSTLNTPIAMDLQRWGDLTIAEIVPPGTEVKKGDVLIRFETDRLKKAIEDLEASLPLARHSFESAEAALAHLEKTTPITLEQSRRSKTEAEQDLAYFEDVSRGMRERDAREDLKSTEQYLAYAVEELEQLKAMYEEDDLTEETEEIILQRAQNSVDNYEWMLEQTKARTDRTLRTSIPREHRQLTSSLELRQLQWREKERTARAAVEKARLELAGKHRELEALEQNLSEHQEDLKALTVTAPVSGIVYYGSNLRGKWVTASAIERKLFPGGKVTMREVLLTIADPDRLALALTIPGGKLKDLVKKQEGTVSPKWNDDIEIPATLGAISYVPLPDGNFAASAELRTGGIEAPLSPGMKAVAEVIVYQSDKALLIPEAAVKTEDDESHVTLESGEKRKVELGFREDDQVEVLKGLKTGDIIKLPGEEEKSDDEPAASDSEKESPESEEPSGKPKGKDSDREKAKGKEKAPKPAPKPKQAPKPQTEEEA